MPLEHDTVCIGLTGAFGSGCTTLATALEEIGFTNIKISDLIRTEWEERRVAEGEQLEVLEGPPRGALQDLGDELRSTVSRSYWVEQAVAFADSGREEVRSLVLDGIRNPAEAEWLRNRFKNFFLVAVDSHPNKRWERLQRTDAWRGRSREYFDAVSARDIEAPEPWGQRVQQCVDAADYLIVNDEDWERPKAEEYLLGKAQDLLGLTQSARRPSDDEFFMHLAYGAANGSACLKRNVGAVIVRPGDLRQISSGEDRKSAASVVSVGFNENPSVMLPCFQEYRACFRDIWRKRVWEESGPALCPHCGASLKGVEWPYICPNHDCRTGSLLETMFPERAMTRCTAIHAEVRAIRAASGQNLRGCQMYATTFPCFLCCEQILETGINKVIYFEPYPDKESEGLLRKHGVTVRRFEGVKSLAFLRFFGAWRATAEQLYSLKPRYGD